MAQPTEGQIIYENNLNDFTYPNGQKIEFKAEGDGFTSEPLEVPLSYDKKGDPVDSVRYQYTISRDGKQLICHVQKTKLTPEVVAKEQADKKAKEEAAKLEEESKKTIAKGKK